jgi:murein DD-endopeptidase MepM/ murein hydrolase activator NlpD
MPRARAPRTKAGRRALKARRRRHALIALTLAALAGLGAIAAALDGSPIAAGTNEAGVMTSTAVAGSAVDVAGEPERDPTPLLATCEGVEVRLPVDPGDITAVAFHQASYPNALSMTSLVPDADMELAAALKRAPDPVADVTEAGTWGGFCLRLWRSGHYGPADTAADVGALPGTTVWAPVTGTVMKVEPYELYDQYEDYRVEIAADGTENIHVVLIHIEDVRISVGDRVTAGVTPIAVVRQLCDKFPVQLGGYTGDGGDHVHFQFNDITIDIDGRPVDES